MEEDMFRRKGGLPLSYRIWLWVDDTKDWFIDNYERVTPWFIGGVGIGLLTVTFIV